MTTVKDIQKAVKHLPYKDFVQFFEWCIHYEEDAWNKKNSWKLSIIVSNRLKPATQ